MMHSRSSRQLRPNAPEEPEPEPPGEGDDEGEPTDPPEGVEVQSATANVGMADYPWHVGGGYYELSNGERVQGQDAAKEAEQKLGE